MSNGTKDFGPYVLHVQLAKLVDSYRGVLRSDERRLHEAMLDFERSCWPDCKVRAA